MRLRWFQNGQSGLAANARKPRPANKTPALKGKTRARTDRGVALILAVISIAILTAVATEFVYSERVDLQMAANQRDDVRAYYMAKSGIGLGRLVLSFQKQLDNIQLPPGINEMVQKLMGGGALTGADQQQQAGTQPPAPTGLNIQLYKLARVDCYMLQAMVPPGAGTDEGETKKSSLSKSGSESGFDDGEGGHLDAPKLKDFGGFDGCFNVTFEPEDPKINLNGLDTGRANTDQLLTILSSKQLEFLFEQEDSNKVKVTPSDLVMAIHDWSDPDKVQSTLDLNPTDPLPLQKGFSDENYNYDRYDPRYQAKNANFDSLDELYMVHGINDQNMAALRDRVTVYSDPNKVANVNTDDPMLLWRAILAVGDYRKDPRLLDPVFVAQLIQAIRLQRTFSFFGSSSQDFVNVLQAKGVPVKPNATQLISDKITTFTIHATGEAGSVKKKITAVVRMEQGQLGQLVYWREE